MSVNDYYRFRFSLVGQIRPDNAEELRLWIGGQGIPFVLVVMYASGITNFRASINFITAVAAKLVIVLNALTYLADSYPRIGGAVIISISSIFLLLFSAALGVYLTNDLQFFGLIETSSFVLYCSLVILAAIAHLKRPPLINGISD